MPSSPTSNNDISTDLADEITSLNSIYSPNTLSLTPVSPSADTTSITLTLPQTPVSILLHFPRTYPASPPSIDRITHVDDSLPKGSGNHILTLAGDVLSEIVADASQAGNVLLYDLIETLESRIAAELPSLTTSAQESDAVQEHVPAGLEASMHAPPQASASASEPGGDFSPPVWMLSEPLISHKSTFLARACAVSSPQEAQAALRHLLATDKRAAKATHNMWAYRIRSTGSGSTPQVVYADADDDGEDGAGAKLAALLQAMGAWGVFVVVSRWYGGVKLGPERWRLIGSVGREAVVRGGEEGKWVVERA